VGDATLPFSVLPAAIQTGLNNARPTGADAVDAASTGDVRVRTANGVTTYSYTFTVSGVTTTVTVDSSGALHSLPGTSTAVYSDIPSAAQDGIAGRWQRPTDLAGRSRRRRV